jgi:hypothetical protein
MHVVVSVPFLGKNGHFFALLRPRIRLPPLTT